MQQRDNKIMLESPRTLGKFAQAEDRADHERTDARESRESKEGEKARVLEVMHQWYELEHKNTPELRRLAELAQEVRRMLTDFLPYWKHATGGKDAYINEDLTSNLVGHYIRVQGIGDVSIPGLIEKMDEDSFLAHFGAKAYESGFVDLRNRIRSAYTEIISLLVAHREYCVRVYRELLQSLGYGVLLADIEQFGLSYQGLYGVDSFFLNKLKNPELAGKKFSELVFTLSGGIHYESLVKNAQNQLGFTDEEIARVQAIEWSPEERDKLERLKRAVKNYAEKLPGITPQEDGVGPATDEEYKLLLKMTVAKYARGAYLRLGLPAVHRERALTQLKLSGEINL